MATETEATTAPETPEAPTFADAIGCNVSGIGTCPDTSHIFQLAEQMEALDECHRAIGDLMVNCSDLHHMDRNAFHTLLVVLIHYVKNPTEGWSREEAIDCLEAVRDLMIPESDLHLVDRDNLSILLYNLTKERERIQQKMDATGWRALLNPYPGHQGCGCGHTK